MIFLYMFYLVLLEMRDRKKPIEAKKCQQWG